MRPTTGRLLVLCGLPIGSCFAPSIELQPVTTGCSSWWTAKTPEERAAEDTERAKREKEDPHKLVERFVKTHKQMFSVALQEIRSGRKESHYSWYIFPTPPYLNIFGWKAGSYYNRYYALETPEQAIAFLRLPTTLGVNLRSNYIQIMTAVADQLEHTKGMTLWLLVGHADEPKVISSAKYFYTTASRIGDEEVAAVCSRLLSLVGEPLPVVHQE